MNFLNSAILVGLAAAVLPIIIHLFARSRSKPVAFSTLRFLRRLQQEKLRRLKLRQILLLILRTLIILLLVLGFARPTCRTPSSGSDSNASTSAVILLDNSLSMARVEEGKTLFHRAKEIAHKVVTNYRPGDELYLVVSTDTSGHAYKTPFHDFSLFQKHINEVAISHKKTDLTAAIKSAQNILSRSKNVNKELVIVSDLQRSAFVPDTVKRAIENIHSYALPVSVHLGNNVSVDSVRLISTILQKGKVVEIEVRLRNHGKNRINDRLVEIFIDDKKAAQKTVDIETEGEVEELFRFVLDRSGMISGRVRLEDDDFLYDNERFFTFFVPEKIHIGMMGSSKETEFIALALQPTLTTPTPFKISKASAEYISSQWLDTTQVMILNNVSKLNPSSVERLKSFVEGGGGLLLILGEASDLTWYNQFFNPPLGIPHFTGTLIGGGTFSIDKTDFTHPIFQGVFETEEAQFTRPFFSSAVSCGRSTYLNKIMTFSSGDPYLFEVRRGQGTILVFTSGLEPKQSDMVYRAIFAPLMQRCAAYLGVRNQKSGEDLLVGQPLRFRLARPDLQADFGILRPDKSIDRVKPILTTSGAWIHYETTDMAGMYQLLVNKLPTAQWAVNMDAREFDFRMMDSKPLKELYCIMLIPSPEQLTMEMRSQRVGKELWHYFVLAVLMLLVIEMLLYRERGETPTEDIQSAA